MNKIAVLADSGTDVPQKYIDRHHITLLPLTINYSDRVFHDRVDITSDDVIASLEREIPKTSLPSMGDTLDLFQSLHDSGTKEVICVTISSGLSGTCGMLRSAAEEFQGMDIRVIDSKNIGIGAGVMAIRAAELAEEGKSLEEIESRLIALTAQTKVFFCMDTLKYLQKGGRIGLVTAAVGTVMGIRPVISCNEEGIYYTVKKARGTKAAMKFAEEQVLSLCKGHQHVRLLVAHAGAEEKAKELARDFTEKTNAEIIFAPVSPALVVHTGPGLIGVGIQYE